MKIKKKKRPNQPGPLLMGFFLSLLVSVSGANAKEQPIRIQIGGEPSTLDPAKVIDQYGFGILRNVVEGLYKLDREGALAKGLMATHKESKDGLTHRFTLHKEAKWSDGKPVTLDEFVFAFQHAVDPKTASPNAEYFFSIKNAKKVFEGKLPPTSLGVSEKKNQLVIELETPDPLLKLHLTLPAAAPLRKDIYKANQGRWKPTSPVTGDYLIKTLNPSEEIFLVPNPLRKKTGQKPIQYRVLREEMAALNLFEAGLLDVVSTIPFQDISRFEKQGLIKKYPATTVFYFSFNVSKPPFNQIIWRKAVAASLDRPGIEKILKKTFLKTTSYLPASIEGSLPYLELQFPEAVKAIQTLEKKPRIRMSFGASNFTKLVSEKVQSDLKKNLGLEVDLESKELKMLLGELRSDPPEMYFLGMSAVFDDPTHQLSAFSTEAGPNFSRYESKVYENYLRQLKSSSKKRRRLAEKANRLLTQDDLIVVPVVVRTQVFGVSKTLKNFYVSPYQVIPLAELRSSN